MSQFWLPTKPYNVIDAINRQGVATGSPQRAMAASSADYNGHRITVTWSSYRRYYVADYYWAGRITIARSTDFSVVLDAAIREYNHQGLGASLIVIPNTDEDTALCAAHPRLQPYDPDYTVAEGKREGSDAKWRATWPDYWKHPLISCEIGYRWNPMRAQANDAALIEATSLEDYKARMATFDAGQQAKWAAR